MIKSVQADLFAVIGNPVKHSLSPVMMNAAFKSLGIPAVYLALHVDVLPEDLKTLSRMGFKGLSVTLPHKETAYRLTRGVDETAQAIGAVNTLRWSGEGWEGCNTDWLGSNRALEQVIQLRGKRALVIGAGGAARAVVYGLGREGAKVTVSNRTTERGQALADSFKCNFIPLPELNDPLHGKSFDIVVQCTSVGLANRESSPLLSEFFFHRGMVVMDTVYRPARTPFVQAAEKAHCVVVPGSDMLLYQGVAQLEWWLGEPVPRTTGIRVMKDALMRALAHE